MSPSIRSSRIVPVWSLEVPRHLKFWAGSGVQCVAEVIQMLLSLRGEGGTGGVQAQTPSEPTTHIKEAAPSTPPLQGTPVPKPHCAPGHSGTLFLLPTP